PARVAAEAAAAPGAEVAAPQGGSGRSVPAAGPAASPSAAEAELARLRGEMQAVLRELEALRALLD
ncbi:MAG: hypothetical protein KGL55_14975, partial [Rhodospirillales bacterium]|nr:hypothetical protein [Rhodospirillales bacterium]